MSNIYYCEKLAFSKLVGKVNYSERRLEEINQLWRAKSKADLGKHLLWHDCLQLSFIYKTMSQISCKLFCSWDKWLLWEFLREWGWFQGHNQRFPKYLTLNWYFKKLRHPFVDEWALITTTLISSCHWKTFVPF